MNTVIGKSRGLPYPARPLYYAEVRIMGQLVLCTIPNRSPAVALRDGRELLEMFG